MHKNQQVPTFNGWKFPGTYNFVNARLSPKSSTLCPPPRPTSGHILAPNKPALSLTPLKSYMYVQDQKAGQPLARG